MPLFTLGGRSFLVTMLAESSLFLLVFLIEIVRFCSEDF